jgi:hypothetical protein
MPKLSPVRTLAGSELSNYKPGMKFLWTYALWRCYVVSPDLRATYRIQLHAGFGFADAAAIVDYLAELGISHLYSSPYLQAATGSTYGYDVVNRGELETELVMRFQQFTGPVMAKELEDTVFYCFNRLVSLNEVGGDPGRFGLSMEEFHADCAEAQTRWPRTMLASSTHDTKRSEDVHANQFIIETTGALEPNRPAMDRTESTLSQALGDPSGAQAAARTAVFVPEDSYRPMAARGERAITVAPRLSLKLAGKWDDTAIEMPPAVGATSSPVRL